MYDMRPQFDIYHHIPRKCLAHEELNYLLEDFPAFHRHSQSEWLVSYHE